MQAVIAAKSHLYITNKMDLLTYDLSERNWLDTEMQAI